MRGGVFARNQISTYFFCQFLLFLWASHSGVSYTRCGGYQRRPSNWMEPQSLRMLSRLGGVFLLTTVLKRRVDGTTFMVFDIYGPTCAALKADFLQELRVIGSRAAGAWVMIGDFNILLSCGDKNGPPSRLSNVPHRPLK